MRAPDGSDDGASGPNPTNIGDTLEEFVERILTLMGYTVRRNELISGTQVDLLADRDDPLDNLRLIVECANRKEPLGIPLLKEKASVLLNPNNSRYLYRLLVVSAAGFTAEAKTYAEGRPQIKLLKPQELERQLINFQPYASWYVNGYENSTGIFSEGQLHAAYVELAGRDADGNLVPSLDQATDQWAAGSDNNILFLLGEFGSGKTSFARQYAYRCLKARYFAGDYTAPTPILINLREYRSAPNLRQVITDSLVNQYGVSLPSFSAFEHVCSSGWIMLLLDGFDEMADRSDKRTLIDCFSQIYLLAALRVKILLTCRSSFFRSHSDVIELLKRFEIGVVLEGEDQPRVGTIGFSQHGRVVYVEKLGARQVEEYIHKRCGAAADSVIRSIRTVHDLSDLATRPVLLDMVVTTLPTLVGTSARINSASLYEHYIGRWTKRDDWRVTLPLEIRQRFCDSLAWEMFSNEIQELAYEELEQLMLPVLGPLAESSGELEQFKNDIQTCAFLVRTGTGERFQFAHKSFIEYLVARTLIQKLVVGQPWHRTLPAKPEQSAAKPQRPPAPSSPPSPAVSVLGLGFTGGVPQAGLTRINHILVLPHFDSLLTWSETADLVWPRPTLQIDSVPARRQHHPKSRPNDVFSDVYAAIQQHLREDASLIAIGGRSIAIDKMVSGEAENLIRSWFEKHKNRISTSTPIPISEEIATFALEYAQNQGISLQQVLDNLKDATAAAIVGELLRMSKASHEYARVNAPAMREYVESGKFASLRLEFCCCLAAQRGLLDASFLDRVRKSLEPVQFSWVLSEIAHHEHNLDLLRVSSQWQGLRRVDQVICSCAVPELRETLLSAKGVIRELLASRHEDERAFGFLLTRQIGISDGGRAELMLDILRGRFAPELRDDALSELATLKGEAVQVLIRDNLDDVKPPSMRKRLKVLLPAKRDPEPVTVERLDLSTRSDIRARLWRMLV